MTGIQQSVFELTSLTSCIHTHRGAWTMAPCTVTLRHVSRNGRSFSGQ